MRDDDEKILAVIDWRGPGDDEVVSGQLDEKGRDNLEVVFDLPYLVGGYANFLSAYEGRPHFDWPKEEEQL